MQHGAHAHSRGNARGHARRVCVRMRIQTHGGTRTRARTGTQMLVLARACNHAATRASNHARLGARDSESEFVSRDS